MISDVVPAKADTKMLNEIASPPYRISVGNSAGSVDGQVAEKRISSRPITARPMPTSGTEPLLSTRIIGKASTTVPIDPTQRIGFRPTRSESRPRNGMMNTATQSTPIWSHCDVVLSIAVPPTTSTLSSR